MKLNQYDIQTHFNGEVCAFPYQSLNSESEFFFPDTSIFAIRLSNRLRPQERTLEMEFWDEADISRFSAELLKHPTNTLDLDDGFLYDIVYRGGNVSTTQVWNHYYMVSYPVYAIQKGTLITTRLTKQTSVLRILGTWETSCRITILPKHDLNEFTINDMTVRNLKQDVPFVIDGIRKLVEAEGVNRFMETNIIKFPSFQPGTHVVRLSEPMDVVIDYYPIYM